MEDFLYRYADLYNGLYYLNLLEEEEVFCPLYLMKLLPAAPGLKVKEENLRTRELPKKSCKARASKRRKMKYE